MSLQISNAKPICSHCNILGHTIDKCYKVHGYPSGYKQNSNNVQAIISIYKVLLSIQQILWLFGKMILLTLPLESLPTQGMHCYNVKPYWINYNRSFLFLQTLLPHMWQVFILILVGLLTLAHLLMFVVQTKMFTSMIPCSSTISLLDKQSFKVKNIGTVCIYDSIVLKNVLCTP